MTKCPKCDSIIMQHPCTCKKYTVYYPAENGELLTGEVWAKSKHAAATSHLKKCYEGKVITIEIEMEDGFIPYVFAEDTVFNITPRITLNYKVEEIASTSEEAKVIKEGVRVDEMVRKVRTFLNS